MPQSPGYDHQENMPGNSKALILAAVIASAGAQCTGCHNTARDELGDILLSTDQLPGAGEPYALPPLATEQIQPPEPHEVAQPTEPDP